MVTTTEIRARDGNKTKKKGIEKQTKQKAPAIQKQSTAEETPANY
jgi:hypothetical protein